MEPTPQSQRPAAERARAIWANGRRRNLDLKLTVGGEPTVHEIDPPRWVEPYLEMADGDFGGLNLTEDDLQPLRGADRPEGLAQVYMDLSTPRPTRMTDLVARMKRHSRWWAVLSVVTAIAVLATGCGLRILPGVDPDECREIDRTGEVEQTIVAEMDLSQSAVDEKEDLIAQTVDLFRDRAGRDDPASSIEVVALSNSVMTQAVQLVPVLTTDFETNGSPSNEEDDFEACQAQFEIELRESLEGLDPYEGSDPLGGAAYAAGRFEAADTPHDLLAQFGDGYAKTAHCDLYQENLADHDAHRELALQCMGDDPPLLTDAEVIQAGVGIRSATQDPGSGDDERSVDLIVFYRETVWPLTGAQYPAEVVTRLGTDES